MPQGEISFSASDIDPVEFSAADLRRPLDPRTGRPVLVPGDKGYVVPGTENQATAMDPRARLLSWILPNKNDAQRAAGAATAVAELPLNIIKGLYSTVTSPVQTAKAAARAQFAQNDKANERFAHARATSGLDKPLSYVEGLGHKLAAFTPLVGPQAAQAGEEIGSGDPYRVGHGMGTGAGLVVTSSPTIQRSIVGAVQRGAGNLARRGALRTMKPESDVLAMTGAPTRAAQEAAIADAALENRVLPGVLTKGGTKSAARMAELDDAANAQLRGPFRPGQARVDAGNVVNGPSTLDTFVNSPRISRQLGAETAQDAAQAVIDKTADQLGASTHANRLGRPRTATELFDFESGTRSNLRGKGPSPEVDIRRALGTDARAEVGRAVPGVAPTLSQIDRLLPVDEAYARTVPQPIDQAGVPTMKARVAVSGINRLFGPTAQGLFDFSRLKNPGLMTQAIQAAIAQQLLGRDASQ